MPSYAIITLGCKVNHYETLQVEQLLLQLGYTRSTPDVADVIIVNSCSVTSAAAAKSRNLLRRHARPRPHSGQSPLTIVMGCWAASDTATAQSIVGPAAVLTHQDDLHSKLLTLLTPTAATGSIQNAIPIQTPTGVGTLTLPSLSTRQPDTQRAILKVQDGCDAHCTYCIIPKLRPIPWSKPIDQAVAEAAALVRAGHVEVVLTGVFLGAYGYSTALRHRQFEAPHTLSDLVHALCTQVPGLRRLRLSSLEPGDLTPSLLATLAAYPQVMPHFHLPLQSGADPILRKMNRQYTRADYLATIGRLRQAFDRPAFTTDIIVGFPGETDDLFAQTLDLARQVGFLHIHAFPFSPRQGTAAARWQKQFVHHQTITHRMAELEQLDLEQSLAYRQQFVGQTAEILVEHPASSDGAEPSHTRGGGAGVGPSDPESRISDIRSQNSNPISQISNLRSQISNFRSQISNFRSQISDLRSQISDLKFQISNPPPTIRHGRCERYFSIHVELPPDTPDPTGRPLRLQITRVTPHRTLGVPVHSQRDP